LTCYDILHFMEKEIYPNLLLAPDKECRLEESERITRNRYLIREEPFGYTILDRETLTHQFIKKERLEEKVGQLGLKTAGYDYYPARRTDYRRDILYSPTRIYFETTLACNLHCKFCYNDSGKPRTTELTTQEVFDALENFRVANVLDIRFTGGELTRRPDWFEILRRAKELNFAVSCNTNGVYLDSTIPERFAELDLEQVTVSIDGAREHHDWHRGKGSFDKTLSSLKRMKKLGVKLRINTLITKASLHDVEYMVELASQYTTEINFFITRFVGRGKNLRIEDAVTFEEFYEMSREVARIRESYPDLHIMHFEEATIKNSSRSGVYEELGIKEGPPDGTTRFNITSDGLLWAILGPFFINFIDLV